MRSSSASSWGSSARKSAVPAVTPRGIEDARHEHVCQHIRLQAIHGGPALHHVGEAERPPPVRF